MKKLLTALSVLTFLAIACAPMAKPPLEMPILPSPDASVASPSGDIPLLPPVSPFRPQPRDNDTGLLRASAYVDSVELRVMESYPVQIRLDISGTLPTPCHQVRTEVMPPDADNRIVVGVYSMVDPNKICAQVLADFEASLDLGGFPSGRYSVWINGEMAGEFDS